MSGNTVTLPVSQHCADALSQNDLVSVRKHHSLTWKIPVLVAKILDGDDSSSGEKQLEVTPQKHLEM